MFPLLVKFEGVGEGQGESIPSPGDGVSGVPPWLRWGFGGPSLAEVGFWGSLPGQWGVRGPSLAAVGFWGSLPRQWGVGGPSRGAGQCCVPTCPEAPAAGRVQRPWSCERRVAGSLAHPVCGTGLGYPGPAASPLGLATPQAGSGWAPEAGQGLRAGVGSCPVSHGQGQEGEGSLG